MKDRVTVQGVVLSAMPVGEYDKRIVLLTKERGKISAFARGARRQNSPLMAAANPFVFGEFTLYEGRTSYTLNQVSITRHFVELAMEQPGIYYGYYFLELADYFGQEGTDERETMNLLYVTVKALLNPRIDDRLVRCVFELRLMTIQGMMPGLFHCCSCGRAIEGEEAFFSQEEHGILGTECRDLKKADRRLSQAALYAMRRAVSADLGRLYTFTVTGEVLGELEGVIHRYVELNTDRRFRSLEVLERMCRLEGKSS
ncbi:MAG: DNA repair protein RecO [Clostridiales bacterium]|nr:DNA repair protein RecO [Clostridiales bacterium]